MNDASPSRDTIPSPDEVELLPEPQFGISRLLRSLLSVLAPFLALTLVWFAFSALDYRRSARLDKPAQFNTRASLQKVLRDASQVGVAALGMTLIIIAGGIDLSAGAAMSLAATTAAWCFRDSLPAPVGIAAALLTGCLAGAINGTLISVLRLVPFIVTLATMTIFHGVGLIIAKDTPIRAFGKVPDWIINLQRPFPKPEWLLVPSGVVVLLLLALLVAILLRLTVLGRHFVALGSNEATARLCGVNVELTRILVYSIAGLLTGVAGLFQFAVLSGEGDPNQGIGKELPVIAAVVIGGGSLSGGRGSILGTLSGACMMSVIQHGCVTLDIRTSLQKVIIGLIILSAVSVDQFRQRRLAS
ncbi:MAG: ABC transporter permease [Planctomycetaceae bacterium]|jgi:ribose transport system permease protein